MIKEYAMNGNLEKLCRRITDCADNQMGIWQWGQGVALYSLSQVAKKQKAEFCMDYIKTWIDGKLSEAYPGKSINTTAPCLSALERYKLSGETKYIKLCEDFADWCMAQAPRSERGAFEHSCTENTYPNQIWADTLFMGCLFLAEYGVFTGRNMYVYEALRQYRLHDEFLKDKSTNLIVHGYYGNERRQEGCVWGRGNGWLAAGTPIILSLADESFSDYHVVKENFIRYMASLVTYQNADGSWNTVVDSSDSYPEMSATAAFAFALSEGMRLGVLDKDCYKKHADLAYAALEKNIGADGTLQNASGGTCIMHTAEEYNAIPVCYSPFAQGLAILALNSRY